jgi:hypothetical protein
MDRMSHRTARQTARVLILALLVAVAVPVATPAQQASFEQIVVGFEVPRLLKTDVFVQYDGTTVYLPLVETFSLLGFNIAVDPATNTISGHLSDKSQTCSIDLTSLRVVTPGADRHLLPSEFSYDGGDLYLRLDLYKEFFGLEMQFDFSLLRVLLPLRDDLPAFQKIKREHQRDKLERQQKALRDVLDLPRQRSYVKGGVLDWRVSASPVGGSGQYYDYSLGGMLLGGDLSVQGGGSTTETFDPNQFQYRWHYFFDNSKYFTQADVGEFYTGGSLAKGLRGVKITNEPQVQRRYFQTLNLSDSLGDGWEVELYVDNRLVDYAVTGPQGRYDFAVDVVYGASDIVVKMYGPNGELRTSERNMRVPYNLIPKGELEYTAAVGEGMGRYEDRGYLQSSAYYGVLKRLTTGASVDMPLGSREDDQFSGSLEATFQAATALTFGGSVSPNNSIVFDGNFSQPSFINVSAGYARYFENPVINPTLQKQRLHLSLSAPLRVGSHYMGLRYFLSRDEFEGFQTTNMNYGLSASIQPFYVNYNGRYKILTSPSRHSSELASQLIATVGLYSWFRPQFRIDYNHTENSLTRYGVFLSKRLFRTGQMSLSFERNVQASLNQFMVTFNFYTSFVEVSSRTMVSGDRVSMSQIQHGSARFDQDSKRLIFDRRTGVGYGSAVVRPFFDANYNGVFDSHEQVLSGLRAKIAGAAGKPMGDNNVFYYDRLRPYDNYVVQIDEYSLDNPLLKPSNENYRVTLNPNVVTAIDVPIVSASEINGSVVRATPGGGTTGVSGVKVVIINTSRDILTEVSTFVDGEYYYLGLLPGTYRAYVDPGQLQRLGYVCEPESVSFEIKPREGGEVIDNIHFTLSPAATTHTPK